MAFSIQITDVDKIAMSHKKTKKAFVREANFP